MRRTNKNETLDSVRTLPHNVKILGLASLLNDIASEMIFPLLPSFLYGPGRQPTSTSA